MVVEIFVSALSSAAKLVARPAYWRFEVFETLVVARGAGPTEYEKQASYG